jgi:DNA-binding MarR family transcriptional regulator
MLTIMHHPVNINETYLYKVRALSNLLERVFDRTLRSRADITLSQFMVLTAISQHPGSNQRRIARRLEISAVAVKRQVDTAKRHGWIEITSQDARGEALRLTEAGDRVLETSIRALEQHVLHIFDGHNRSLNLMRHIDLLHGQAKDVLKDTH